MKIIIGADHRGCSLKKKIAQYLCRKGYAVVDVGTHTNSVSCDYPVISKKVAKIVATTKNARGILVCMTGIGHSIAANKIPGVRAALCYNKKAAYFSRAHNDSNVLVIGAKFVTQKQIEDIVKTWIKTPFEGGRHARRVGQIKKIEKEFLKAIRV